MFTSYKELINIIEIRLKPYADNAIGEHEATCGTDLANKSWSLKYRVAETNIKEPAHSISIESRRNKGMLLLPILFKLLLREMIRMDTRSSPLTKSAKIVAHVENFM